MNGILYLLQVNIYLFAFYAFYRLLLSKETFFGLNRFYLIGSTLLSFSIPVLQSDWLKNWLAPTPVQDLAVQINLQAYEFLYVPKGEVAIVSLGDLLGWVYIGVAGLLSLRLLYRIINVYRLMSNPQNGLQACSFFNYLSVNDDLEGREAIMVHEQVHVRQLHSADILFFEIHAIINWFNPISYLLKGEIRKVHEYIADATASETLPEKSAYAMLLFQQKFGLKHRKLTNSFFNQSILKQRIMMLQKNKSKRRALWKYGFTAPLFMGMLIISSAFVSEKSTQSLEILDQGIVVDSIPKKPQEKNTLRISPTQTKLQRVLDSIPKEKRLLPPIIAGKEPLYIDNGKIVEKAYGGRTGLDVEVNLEYTQVIRPPLSTKLFGEKAKHGVYISQFKDAPIYLVNGKETPKAEIDYIDPNAISTINVLGPDKAVKLYGERAKHGAVEIILKPLRVVEGKPLATEQAIKVVEGQPLYIVEGKPMEGVQAEKNPEFPGGQAAWAKFLQSEMKYPAAAREKKISGKVMVSFMVEKSGELSEVKVLRGISKDLDEEAIRVISKSPKWIPATKDGQVVRSSIVIPVLFQLQS